MHTPHIETDRVAETAASAFARRARLHDAAVAQAAYSLARKINRKGSARSGAAGVTGLRLCALARTDLDEQVERLRNNGELLHFGALVLA